MIYTKNLKKIFDDKVINYSDYKFDKGINLIKGANGSGKSTLLKILAGVDTKYQGVVTETNHQLNIYEEKLKEFKSYLPDTPTFFSQIFVKDIIRTLSKVRKVNSTDQINFLINNLNFQEEDLEQKFEALSLGQRKKLFLSLSLLPHLEYWILDEPENALDKQTIKSFRKIINENSYHKTIIITSHIINEKNELSNCHLINLN